VVPQVLRRGEKVRKNVSFFWGLTMIFFLFGGLQNEQLSAELEMILRFFFKSCGFWLKKWCFLDKMFCLNVTSPFFWREGLFFGSTSPSKKRALPQNHLVCPHWMSTFPSNFCFQRQISKKQMEQTILLVTIASQKDFDRGNNLLPTTFPQNYPTIFALSLIRPPKKSGQME